MGNSLSLEVQLVYAAKQKKTIYEFVDFLFVAKQTSANLKTKHQKNKTIFAHYTCDVMLKMACLSAQIHFAKRNEWKKRKN